MFYVIKVECIDMSQLLEEQEFIIGKKFEEFKKHIVNSLKMLILTFLMISMK